MRVPIVCWICLLVTLPVSAQAEEVLQVECHKSFPEAMLDLQQAIKAGGQQVLKVQKVDKALQGSGYAASEYRIVFFGDEQQNAAWQHHHPEIIPLLPLKITIFNDHEVVRAVIPAPTVFLRLYADRRLDSLIGQWQQTVSRIMHIYQGLCSTG